MGSQPPSSESQPPHAVMIPYPAQGHVTPMLQLAKLLHARGFHVTFVNTEFNHRRLLRARGPGALDGAPGFRFAAIDDGLPPSDADATQDVPSLCHSTMTTCLPRFKALLAALDAEAAAAEGGGPPPVSCVVGDSIMTFSLRAARELGLPCATLWTASACGYLGYHHYRHLVDRGLAPLKHEHEQEQLDAVVGGWIPGAPADLRLRDVPSFVRTTDPDDVMLNFFIHETAGMAQASAVAVNTFDGLDAGTLDAMARLLRRPVYAVGPLPLAVRNNTPADSPAAAAMGSNLWKEDAGCLAWLDTQAPRSVVYVNFGSITVMSAEQLAEFAWGLAATGYAFLWNVRPDLVKGGDGSSAAGAAGLPPEFAAATEGRGMLSTWCPQAAVLEHHAVGVFLTHSGWNSTLESICGGVPMVCWPFFAEQQTNCRYKRTEWGIGMEIADDVRRADVEALIREAMEGDKGREMRRRVTQLRDSAVAAAAPGGPAMRNLDRLIHDVLAPSFKP